MKGGTLAIALLSLGLMLVGVPGGAAQTDLRPEPAPERPPVFRDFFPQCRSDGPDGMIQRDSTRHRSGGGSSGDDNDDPTPVIHSYVRGLSPLNGTRQWSYDNMDWAALSPGVTWAPVRGGSYWTTTNPKPYYAAGPVAPDNLQPVGDVTGDGICDFAAYGYEFWGGYGGRWGGDGRLAVINGANGTPVWEIPIHWEAESFPCLITGASAYPSGMLAYASRTGPKLVWKVTTGSWTCRGSRITDHVQVLDARNGLVMWETNTTDSARVFLTQYITGVADLEGTGEPSVVLDVSVLPFCKGPSLLQSLGDNFHLPQQVVDVLKDLLEVQPQWPSVRALSGSDGSVLWGPTNLYITPKGGLSLDEESLECLLTSNAQIIGDVDGDDRSDVVGTYLVQEINDVATFNGRFRTHVAPVSGATGNLFWSNHVVKQQGWGYVADLNVGEKKHPYFGIGLVDVPEGIGMYSPSQEGRRPPEKDVRIAVLRASDGASTWGTRSQPIALDSRLAYDFALNQLKTNLAPADFDGDGVKDFVMPGRYEPPTSNEQVLLSTAAHTYDVVSGRTGKLLQVINAFGPLGQVIACPGEKSGTLTVAMGHARRFDIARKTASDAEEWRQAVWVDRRPQAQIAVTNIEWIGGRCEVMKDGRTFFGFDMGVYSDRRGRENRGFRGFVGTNGALEWIEPTLYYPPPNAASLREFKDAPPEDPTWAHVAMPSVVVGFGLATAVGLANLSLRRFPRKPMGAPASLGEGTT